MTNKKTANHLTKKAFILGIVFLVSISAILLLSHLETPANASVENITDEKKSTVSKAESNSTGDEVGMTFVITDAPSNINSTKAIPNTNSDSLSKKNESSLAQSTDTNQASSQTDSNQSSKPVNQDTTDTSNQNTHTKNMQRGEYKVDDNGIHYYNINNCSKVKGSSGIGDLSECEDAENEMLKER